MEENNNKDYKQKEILDDIKGGNKYDKTKSWKIRPDITFCFSLLVARPLGAAVWHDVVELGYFRSRLDCVGGKLPRLVLIPSVSRHKQ